MIHKPHLFAAHQFWKSIVTPEDIIIDATCGNGHDALFLAKLSANLLAMDIQQIAIEHTRNLLKNHLSKDCFDKITFLQACHSQFPITILENSVKLIVYNLGYLPKGEKSQTTMTVTTLKSLKQALRLICQEGVICMTCYPGHEEGKKEENALTEFIRSLNAKEWLCSYQQWINRRDSPSLIILQKL